MLSSVRLDSVSLAADFLARVPQNGDLREGGLTYTVTMTGVFTFGAEEFPFSVVQTLQTHLLARYHESTLDPELPAMLFEANGGSQNLRLPSFVRDGLTYEPDISVAWRIFVPEPATGLLMSLGLVGLGIVSRNRRSA